MVKGPSTEESAKSSQEGSNPSKPPRPATPQLMLLERFGHIDRNYAIARAQTWLSSRRRLEAAHRRYAEGAVARQNDTQTKIAHAYQQGVDAWEANRSDDALKQYQDLNRQYMSALGAIYDDARLHSEEDLRILNKEMEDASKEYNESIRNAYRDYLSSLQEFWRSLDVDAVVEAYALAAAMLPQAPNGNPR